MVRTKIDERKPCIQENTNMIQIALKTEDHRASCHKCFFLNNLSFNVVIRAIGDST